MLLVNNICKHIFKFRYIFICMYSWPVPKNTSTWSNLKPDGSNHRIRSLHFFGIPKQEMQDIPTVPTQERAAVLSQAFSTTAQDTGRPRTFEVPTSISGASHEISSRSLPKLVLRGVAYSFFAPGTNPSCTILRHVCSSQNSDSSLNHIYLLTFSFVGIRNVVVPVFREFSHTFLAGCSFAKVTSPHIRQWLSLVSDSAFMMGSIGLSGIEVTFLPAGLKDLSALAVSMLYLPVELSRGITRGRNDMGPRHHSSPGQQGMGAGRESLHNYRETAQWPASATLLAAGRRWPEFLNGVAMQVSLQFTFCWRLRPATARKLKWPAFSPSCGGQLSGSSFRIHESIIFQSEPGSVKLLWH